MTKHKTHMYNICMGVFSSEYCDYANFELSLLSVRHFESNVWGMWNDFLDRNWCRYPLPTQTVTIVCRSGFFYMSHKTLNLLFDGH